LGEDAAQALAAALTVNKSLKSLALDGFRLKKEGLFSLAAAMETNHTLYGLTFDPESGEELNSKVQAEVNSKLRQYIARNMLRAFGSVSSHAPVQGCPHAGLEHSIESAPAGCVRSGTC
jgi:hypothetical protein